MCEHHQLPASSTDLSALAAAAAPGFSKKFRLADAIQPSLAPPAAHSKGCRKMLRYKLWDLPGMLFCPVIGTCLEVDELRQLARRSGRDDVARGSDYEVHVTFVGACSQRNSLSLAAQKTLERKHAAQIRLSQKARDPQQLQQFWENALAEGQVPGGFWATLTHPQCDENLRTLVWQEVHMLSHQIGAGQRADLRALAETRASLAQIQAEHERQMQRLRSMLAERDKRIAALENEQVAYQQREKGLQKALQTLHSDWERWGGHNAVQTLEQVQQRWQLAQRLLGEARTERDQALADVQTWQHERVRAEAERRALRQQVAYLERVLLEPESECQHCLAQEQGQCLNLCGRKILCVGGRTQAVEQYRAMVANYNGLFEHYDGGIEDHRQRLDQLLASADIVVCTTDQVSHDAYYRSKRHCKRTAKPCVLIRSSGVSSFARALETLSDVKQEDGAATGVKII